MHFQPARSLMLKRILFGATLFAIAISTVSCDRDSPTSVTPSGQSLGDGGTTAGATTFSAKAMGARGTVLGVGVYVCGAGPLPPQGGQHGNAVLKGRIGGNLYASSFHTVAFGHGDRSKAHATAADLHIRVGVHTIVACVAMSGAEAKCVNGQVTLWAGSDLADVRVNGQRIAVTGQPNQTIMLPLGAGRIVINEQVRGAASITVRALRVSVLGNADIVVAEAQAGINCGTNDCGGQKDFVCGGGWIDGPSGSKATFGVSGGTKNGSVWGYLCYTDNGGPSVRGTGVTSYSIVNAKSRHIEGTCTVNGQAGFTYQVDVTDNGAGITDTFSIRLSNGYQASGTLKGGNITLHTPCK